MHLVSASLAGGQPGAAARAGGADAEGEAEGLGGVLRPHAGGRRQEDPQEETLTTLVSARPPRPAPPCFSPRQTFFDELHG